MIEVELPDGTIAEFPDGTSPEAIKGALQKRFSPQAQRPAEDKSYTGSILPFSVDAQGNKSFDSNAGILGSIKRALTLPGDAYYGKVDPMSEEGRARAMEFASVISPVNPAVRSGDRLIPGVARAMTKEKVAAPTAEALKSAAASGYEAMRASGVDYSATSIKNLAQSMRAKLEADGILPELAPKAFSVLSKLENPPAGGVAPIAGIEAARRAFRNAAKDFNNPTDQLAAKRIIDGLDEFIMAADPQSIVAGPARDAARILKGARANYAAKKRSEKLTGVQEAAQLRADAANSGQNLGNSTRQRVASLTLSAKERAAYSPEEIEALKSVVKGSVPANSTRYVGNLLGGGGGLGSVVTSMAGAGSGAMTGSPALTVAGAGLPLVGALSKKASNALTERALAKVDEATRKRSPLYEEAVAQAKFIADPAERRAFMNRVILLLSQQPNSGHPLTDRSAKTSRR